MARISEEPASSPRQHEVFQLKQGLDYDISSSTVSEMLKSSSVDNAPTQSLLNVVRVILDEKRGEIPDKVACLLRKIVQEIERRISKQADHIRNLNNIFKAREEKYESRIRLLETLAAGTNKECQVSEVGTSALQTNQNSNGVSGNRNPFSLFSLNKIVENQLQQMKHQKAKTEDRKRQEDQNLAKAMKDKEESDNMVLNLKEELEIKNKTHEEYCFRMEAKIKETKSKLEEKTKELDDQKGEVCSTLEELNQTKRQLEFSESRILECKRKEDAYKNFICFQLQAMQDLRLESHSIKNEVLHTQSGLSEEYTILTKKVKELAGTAEICHSVLEENRKIYNELQDLKGNIRVYCRIRPFSSNKPGKLTIVDYIGENGELLVTNPSKPGKEGHRMFKFNKVFGPASSQEEVYLDTQPLIRSILDGFNVCIFAYGQTGSGKTYTMSGPNSPTKENWGVNYRALNDLFQISETRKNSFTYEVDVQMVEIYNEQVRDLLANDGQQKKLGIRNASQLNGLVVPNACVRSVNSTEDVVELMKYGQMNRASSATALNERSSRSHSVLSVHVRGVDLKTKAQLRGCLHLVDLAGSERINRSEVAGDRLKEAQHINKSLSALGDVISALSQKSLHVPYRNSKLTQLLQSSLGGRAKTLMFVQMNPDAESFSETISTLKFAERVSGVELGAARSNKDGKEIRELMDQVAFLKDTITRKDEEIEQLQFLKEEKNQTVNLDSQK